MERTRIIGFIAAFVIYGAAFYPREALFIGIAIVILYFIYVFVITLRADKRQKQDEAKQLRMISVLNARMYLAPYKDIWKNMKLSNKYVSARLGSDGKTVTVTEVSNDTNAQRIFVFNAVNNQLPDMWNIFCNNFNNFSTYSSLMELCIMYNVQVTEQKINKSNKITEFIEKVDINNASEAEITKLPGISIVLSKKIIKKREEIGGFKTIDDVCIFLKLKPHLEKQIREKICVNKMKGSLKIKHSTERQIDL